MKSFNFKGVLFPVIILIIFIFYSLINAQEILVVIRSLCGIVILLFIAFIFSSNKNSIDYNTILWGISLQILMGFFVLNTSIGYEIFKDISFFVSKLLDFTRVGTNFVFGDLGNRLSNTNAFEKTVQNFPSINTLGELNLGFFAFTVLPVVIFVSSLSAILYYLGVLQFVVLIFARILKYFLKISGAESLATTANIFIGQTEAPLIVRPYIPKMTNSELLVLMTGGMATVSGSVLVAYIGILQKHPIIGPTIGVHLITASVMAAPAAIVVAKIVYPEKLTPQTQDSAKINIKTDDVNIIDAASRGALEGLQLALNIMGMLIAFIAIIALCNYLIGTCFDNALLALGIKPLHLSLEKIFAFIFWPFAFLIGVPVEECFKVATLLGEKLVINEFVAYLHLGKVMTSLSERSFILASYALCGFANFSSIAIQIGGIGGIAPNRRHDLARFGIRAMIGGTIVSYINAAIASIFIL
ncbi:MAG: nucleoside transporter C-terminal domain-containing protein [Deferribacterota bacterium]|nr:nucleoside transporter C-terminal domain-containing protein [Deferribacterota bacterium]